MRADELMEVMDEYAECTAVTLGGRHLRVGRARMTGVIGEGGQPR